MGGGGRGGCGGSGGCGGCGGCGGGRLSTALWEGRGGEEKRSDRVK